jgi:HEAT repeat protein
LVEALACIGVMESSEAAQVLALQLGYFNSRMERNGEFDEEVTLGVISALGELGDKLAYDQLLYISQLPYPYEIQTAAKEALSRLKW